MNAVDFACLWFGRFWGCFFAAAVLFVAWLAVRDRLEDRRERLAETLRSHPAALSDDWREDVRRDTDDDDPHLDPNRCKCEKCLELIGYGRLLLAMRDQEIADLQASWDAPAHRRTA